MSVTLIQHARGLRKVRNSGCEEGRFDRGGDAGRDDGVLREDYCDKKQVYAKVTGHSQGLKQAPKRDAGTWS